jgi:VacB/RNase II family 3'-5' exoribonuclease
MTTPPGHHVDLAAIARRVMIERGLEPDYPPAALQQVHDLRGPAEEPGAGIRDLRDLPWASIDNDDSRDLDQLTVAQDNGGGAVRIMVAVADVDALVKAGSPVDQHAQLNTTSVYTAAGNFPMLPERLSTDLTSLNEGQDRLAIVVAYDVDVEGGIGAWEVLRARVHNQAQLAYSAVAAWLDGHGAMPEAMDRAHGVADQIRLQDAVAQRLKARRHEHGALDLETIEPRAVVSDGQVLDLVVEEKNRAHKLIEDFMVAANGVTTLFLEQRGLPTFRRVVRVPHRWDRIQAVAAALGEQLPATPDAGALNRFLARRRVADPLRFPDLSLTIVKLIGSGEYAVQLPGEEPIGHFGLAVRDYSHSTAPNRRYPDLITQRLLKAALGGAGTPYPLDHLRELALHCTEQEDAVQKVERQVQKSAAAMLLAGRIGETFDGVVTGAGPKGTWVRILQVPVEGMLVDGARGVDVGDRVAVKLVHVDIERGFIDFAREGR